MLSKTSLLILSSLLLFLNCTLFENEQASIFQCTETDLSNAVLHTGIFDFPNSRIEAYEAETLEFLYQIDLPINPPNHIDYNNNNDFFYSVRITPKESVIYRRDVDQGILIDSLRTFQSDYFRLNDSTFIAYGIGPTFMVVGNRVKREGFDQHVMQALHQVDHENYAIYGDIDNVYFGTVDTTGFTLIKDLSEVIQSTIRNGIAHSMHYIPEENRLLVMMENVPQAPNSVLFDIDLTTNQFKATAAGQNAEIVGTEDPRYFFLTHRSTFNLNSVPSQFINAYDKNEKKLFPLIDIKKEFGSNAFIHGITTIGCTVFVSFEPMKLGDLIIQYNLKTGNITRRYIYESDNFLIHTLNLSTNTN